MAISAILTLASSEEQSYSHLGIRALNTPGISLTSGRDETSKGPRIVRAFRSKEKLVTFLLGLFVLNCLVNFYL